MDLHHLRHQTNFSVIIVLFLWFMLSASSLAADPQMAWEELSTQANTEFEQGQYEQAVSTATKALEFAESNFGASHPSTMNSYYTLGSFYHNLGYPDLAIPLYENALISAIGIFGDASAEVMMIMANLVDVYAVQGQLEDAIKMAGKVYTFKKNLQGSNDLDTVASLITLAQLKGALGLYEEAIQLYEQAIQVYEMTAGADHPDALIAKEGLATVYKNQGNFDAALELLRNVYIAQKSQYGPDSPDVLISAGILGEILHKKGEYDEAESLYLNTIEKLGMVLGKEDPELYSVKANLAQLYQDLGQYQKAEQQFLEIYNFEKKVLGEEHPNTIIDLNNLAGIYRLQGQYEKAEEAYYAALSSIKKVYGEKHPETISIMNNLGLLHENQGMFDLSEPLYKTALKNAEEILGEKHPTTLALMINLASLYESQGVFERSEPLYNRAILISKEIYGPEHPNSLAAINNLGYLYLMQDQYNKANPKFADVFEAWRRQFGEKHQNTLKALNNLARVYHKQNKTELAQSMLEDSLRMRREVLGEKHPDVIRSMIDLSALYITIKKYGEAEELLLKTINLAEEILGDKHQYTFEAVNNLADLYEKSGKKLEARDVRKKGFDRRTQFFERVLWAAGENTRQSYIQLHNPEKDKYLSLLLETKGRESGILALDASLQRKSLLLKITSEIQRIVDMIDSPELAAKAKALDEKRKQLASMTLSGPTSETPTEFRKTIAKLENEVDELQAELGRVSQIYFINFKPTSVENVFENLEPEDVLIDYIAYNDGVDKMFAVVAQTDKEKCFNWWQCAGNKIDLVPLGELKPIKRAIDVFRETIQDEESEEEDILETGFDVYSRIWMPLVSHIKQKKSIYIVPDSVLHLLPFDALVTEFDTYLIQSKDLKILSSSRDLVVAALPDAQGEFLIMAGPDFDLDDAKVKQEKQIIATRRSGVDRGLRISHGLRSLSFEPLLGAELEGKTIKQVSDSFEALPGASKEGQDIKLVAQKSSDSSIIYLNQQAEEAQLRGLKKSPQMIHIATHGFFLEAEERLKKRLLSMQRGGPQTIPPPGDNPLLRAGLAFAGINSNAPFLGEIDTDNDGVLTALEVLSLDLSGTRLVVLSACETGVGEIHAGEGVYGLRRAFQEAGVKSVVNSLWPVSDEGTRRLMTSFYRHLFNKTPPREALKAAQLEMLNSDWNSPYYWASFVLVERRFTSDF